VIIWVVVLSMPLLVIHSPHYLSHGSVTFWTRSSMKSLKAQPLSFWYWNVVYFSNMELFTAAATCTKNYINSLVHLLIFLQQDNSAPFVMPKPCITCLLLLSIISSFIFLIFSVFLFCLHNFCCVNGWKRPYILLIWPYLYQKLAMTVPTHETFIEMD
jgi:hypothetical protein